MECYTGSYKARMEREKANEGRNSGFEERSRDTWAR
jgi:hypothetical protein